VSVYVRFDGEIRLYDEDVPAEQNFQTIAEAVQSVIGHTGAAVVDVAEYEDDGLERTEQP
jgi:hypothetical protein